MNSRVAPSANRLPGAAPLTIGNSINVWPPVVLAPMAGITNEPFRRLCREQGAALFVSEMITARALIEGNLKTERLASFAPDETPRSLQLYGTDPVVMAEAARRLVDGDRVDHIDINIGCPAPKVTRRGGGAALPVRRRLLDRILTAVVAAAAPVPVTVKFRIGVDAEHETFLDTARIAEQAGCSWVALHARTAHQLYSGTAKWSRIAELVEAVSIPVLGNGDIWTADDAVRMMDETGCAGVVVGRGCLGNPWLFAELTARFDGRPPPARRSLGDVTATMVRHLDLLTAWAGSPLAVREFRKHTGWYLKGYPVGNSLRHDLAQIDSAAQLADMLAGLDPTTTLVDPDQPIRRGRHDGPRRVQLPDAWYELADSEDALDPSADCAVSGG